MNIAFFLVDRVAERKDKHAHVKLQQDIPLANFLLRRDCNLLNAPVQRCCEDLQALRGNFPGLLQVEVPGRSVSGEGANLTRFVLGCIEAKFCKQLVNTRWKALAEIYTMHSFAPFSWNL